MDQYLVVMRVPGSLAWVPGTCCDLDDGKPCLHDGARADPALA